jgi:hypothetical protein
MIFNCLSFAVQLTPIDTGTAAKVRSSTFGADGL